MLAIPLLALALALPFASTESAPGQVIISTKMSTISGIVSVVGEKLYLVGKKRVLLSVIDPAMKDALTAAKGKQRSVTGTPDLVSGTGAFLVTGVR